MSPHQAKSSWRVLVLDDSQADAELAIEALRQPAAAVEWLRADTRGSFQAALANGPWDLILADFTLQHFSGIEALKLLKSSGHDIPLLLVSATVGEEVIVEGMRAGADDFFGKGRLTRLAPVAERAIREAGHRREKARVEQEKRFLLERWRLHERQMVTQLSHKTEELRLLAERWRLLVDHAIDGVALQQAIWASPGRLSDYRFLEWNPAAQRILGLDPGQVIGRTAGEVWPAGLQNGWLARYARVLTTGRSERIEDCPVTVGGIEKRLDLACFPLDANHFVTLFRDVTERQTTQHRLRQYAAEMVLANQNLEKVNAELGRRNSELEEFTHVASHDLQEPLRKVVSFGDLLARALGDRLDEKSMQYLRIMQDATRRQQALIRDLLVLSRAGRATLRLEPVPLEDCACSALDQLADRVASSGACVRLDPLPTLTVDARQVSQLYENLISNALTFRRPQHKPHIRLTCEQTTGGPVLGVADNGIGIDPQYHERIFRAFQRLHGREEYEGSGVGLSVCRKIVERHGGRIWVDSRPGEGAHFRFVLRSPAGT
jgi:PAS domain S-box-containing protein